MNTEQMVVHDVVERVLVSGLVPIDEATWAIYGSIPVDGQVIVAEFGDRAVAESALERIAAEQYEQEMRRQVGTVLGGRPRSPVPHPL